VYISKREIEKWEGERDTHREETKTIWENVHVTTFVNFYVISF
jgi:hypothetical protein